ncbi:hypothetical protein Hte_011006 [Hypoxylon texense]
MHRLLRQLAFLAFPLMGMVGEVSASTPSTGCGKAPTLITPDAASTPLTLSHNNKQRQYYVKLPADYDQNHPYRLVFTLHALMGTAKQVTAGTDGYLPWYGLPDQMNDTVSAIYIAPDGLNNGWANTGGEDVGFLQKVMEAVEGDLCVDQSLRFSTGFSYGAAMSYALACSLGKQIRAVAALSGNPAISGCSGGAEPVAYYGEHGVGDQVLPIAGGREMRDRFVRNNGCAPQDAPEPAAGSGTHTKTTYAGCDPDYPVVWVAFDGDHTPQPMDRGVQATFAAAESWSFFSQFK